MSTIPVKRHPEYFFQEGDVTFKVCHPTLGFSSLQSRSQVESTMFRVHKRFFFRESSHFRSLFNSPAIPCPDPPGSSETNPVVFKEKDVTSDAFAHLLWIFYNP